jgi:hypothetical protein
MTDEIEHLRSVRPPTGGPSPALVADERNALMAYITAATPDATVGLPPPRRRRKRWLVPVVVVAAGSTAAAGWAALRTDPKTTTAVQCGDSVVDASTGDPVADCAALWLRERGTVAPPLVAYVNPGGGVRVIPEGQDPGKGFTPLARTFRQDTALIELEGELGDVSRGLAAACLGEAQARRMVSDQLRRLGLSGWTSRVRADDPGPGLRNADGTPADGPPACPSGAARYTPIVHPDTKQVELVAGLDQGTAEGVPYATLARWLTDQLVEGPDASCLPVDQAAALARQEAARVGLDETRGDVVFHVVPATDATSPTCARPTTTVGGTVEVTIRAVPR